MPSRTNPTGRRPRPAHLDALMPRTRALEKKLGLPRTAMAPETVAALELATTGLRLLPLIRRTVRPALSPS